MPIRLKPACLALVILACASLALPGRAQKSDTRREQAALAEDQALLQRQLSRLRATMEALAQRFDTEGRTHAAKLLRDGLKHIDERAAERGSKTLEELMTTAHSSLESGLSVQAIETQEAVVKGLERLYAILTDRQGLEDLEKSLADLKEIQKELAQLADREQALRQHTKELGEKAQSPEQIALEAGIQKAIEAQRELLSKTESQGRTSNQLEMEALQKALDELIQREATDRSVLEAWKPDEKRALEQAAPRLAQANEHAARAQRLSQAAAELRAASRAERAEDADSQALQRDMDRAAEREERHQRAASDPAAAKTAEAFKGASEDLRKSGAEAGARNRTADSIEKRADDLSRAAAEEDAAAKSAEEAAKAELAALKDESTAAGRVAQSVRKALEKSARASPSAPEQKPGEADPSDGADEEKRLSEAQKSREDGQRALNAGLDDMRMLKQALSSSQAQASQEAQRLKRGLESLPQGASREGQDAAEKLDAAARAQETAAEKAGKEQSSEAAQAAQAAEKALQQAREALAKMTARNAAEKAQSAEEKALAEEQKTLAAKMDDLERAAQESSLTPQAKEEAKAALEGAQQAMQKSAQSLSQGQSSKSASAQNQALDELQKAAESARSGTELKRPEDKARAKQLSEEQEKIRQKLLELAQRNQKRDAAQPMPSLDKAEGSAAQAQESLDQGDLQQSQESEEDTEREMRQAMRELSQEEEQYQKLRQEELLFKIAGEVKSLIEEHRREMRATREVDAGRKGDERATHTQRLRLRKIAKSEETLGAHAGEIHKAILAESSVVFAEVLDQARRDLERLGRDMGEAGDYQSGERVQALQQDVEQSLQWLSEALESEKERRRQEQQQQQDDPQKNQDAQNRLVPDVAELKLLRRLEVETLDDLTQMQRLHPELTASGEIEPLVLEDLARLAHRHQRTSDLFQQFRKRLGLPDPEVQQQ